MYLFKDNILDILWSGKLLWSVAETPIEELLPIPYARDQRFESNHQQFYRYKRPRMTHWI